MLQRDVATKHSDHKEKKLPLLETVLRSSTQISLALALVTSAAAQTSQPHQTGTAMPPAIGNPPPPASGKQDELAERPTAENSSDPGRRPAVATVDPLAKNREAFFSAHLAALHAGLTLTPDQEGLWAPIETAIRTLDKTNNPRRSREDIAGLLSQSPSDLLRMRGEQLSQRGDAMRKLAEATAPLVERLDSAQKERLPLLLDGMRPARVLRAAFDIRFGKVVEDSGEESDRQGGEHGDGRHTSSDGTGDADRQMSQGRSHGAAQDGMGASEGRYERSESDDRGREPMRQERDRFDMGGGDRS